MREFKVGDSVRLKPFDSMDIPSNNLVERREYKRLTPPYIIRGKEDVHNPPFKHMYNINSRYWVYDVYLMPLELPEILYNKE